MRACTVAFFRRASSCAASRSRRAKLPVEILYVFLGYVEDRRVNHRFPGGEVIFVAH